MRLIDADSIHAKIYEDSERSYGAEANIAQVLLRIETAPTIEPEVRHGRWIVNTTWYGMFGIIHSECSECKFDRNGDLSSWKFCPNCGARMDGGAENG